MRLLVLYQGHDARADQPGYFEGFERLVREGALQSHTALACNALAARLGWDGLWEEVYTQARQTEADAVFLQFFHGPIPDPAPGLRRLQSLPAQPTLFSSLGDPFGRWSNRVPSAFRIASALSAVTFLTGMGYLARQLRASGSRNLVLMPNGCCQVRFAAPPPSPSAPAEFACSFVGSRIPSRNPCNALFWAARKSAEFVRAVTQRYGRRFALFGQNWAGNPSWQGPIPYVRQQEAYHRAEVALGGMPNSRHDFYTSDRVFIAIASGTPLVDYAVPAVDRLLEPAVDWWLARSLPETLRLCDSLLDLSPSERLRLGRHARERILAAHTQYHRCRQMLDIVQSLRAARAKGIRAPVPQWPFDTRPAPPADWTHNWSG